MASTRADLLSKGSDGQVTLRRPRPEPIVLSSVATNPEESSITLINLDYWTGDKVYLACGDGLPFFQNDLDPYSHLRSDLECYIHRDLGDRISFYITEEDAINGDIERRLPLAPIPPPPDSGVPNPNTGPPVRFQPGEDGAEFTPPPSFQTLPQRLDPVEPPLAFRYLIMAPTGGPEYRSRILRAALDLRDIAPPEPVDAEYPLSVLIPPEACPPEPATDDDWQIQNSVLSWRFNSSRETLDVAAIGELYGEAIAAQVTGNGELSFYLGTKKQVGQLDNNQVLQLHQYREYNAPAESRLVWGGKGASKYWYEIQMLVTSATIDTRADDLVQASMSFLAVGPFRVRAGRL